MRGCRQYEVGVFLIILLFPLHLHASFGASAASFLDIPLGGRPAALGGAYTAMANDAHAPIWNPSGLGFLDAPQFTGTHLSYLESISYEYLSVGVPFGERHGWGAAAQYFRPDDLPETDALGNSIGTFSGSYGAYSLAYGLRFGDILAVGSTAKYLRAEIDDVNANGYGFDIGGLYRPKHFWSLAATIANLGSHLKFIDQSDSIPVIFRVGMALQPLSQLIVSVQGDFPKSETASAHTGIEWSPIPLLSLRTGYRTDTSRRLSGTAGFTAGMGIKWKEQQFDYTWGTMDDLGNVQYFSLLLKWKTSEKN